MAGTTHNKTCGLAGWVIKCINAEAAATQYWAPEPTEVDKSQPVTLGGHHYLWRWIVERHGLAKNVAFPRFRDFCSTRMVSLCI